MFFNNLLKSGWLHAMFIAVIAYPITSMTLKIVSSYTNTNILVYTAFIMLSCSVTLLLISGPGALSIKTIKRPETWGYSILQIISYILLLLSMVYISATEGAALGKMGGLFVFVFSILFLNQKVNKYEITGSLIMLLGFFLIIYNAPLSAESKAVLSIVVIARALVQCGQKMITEVHKTNRKAVSFKEQIRVTGFIMSIASFVFILFLLVIAGFKFNYDIKLFNAFPNFIDFINFNSFLLGVFLGALIISISKYCEFYAGKTIGSKYLSSISSFELVFIFLLEIIIINYADIEARNFTYSTVLSLLCILSGSLLIALSGFIKDLSFIKKGEKQDTLANMDSNFLEDEKDFELLKLNLSNLLALYNQDSKKLAEDLGADRIKLENILNYDLSEQKITNKLAKKINDFASSQVSNKDKLTKAYNRYYLEHKFAELKKSKTKFNLYYLDLNKFKPINDTYGHEVGDYILSKTVDKLNALENFKDHVFRIGGDEFVLIQTTMLAEDLSELITQTIEVPTDYNNEKLVISTSIGLVSSANYSNLNDMLKNADELMFKNKKIDK